MEAMYALIRCETEWILLSSLKDYQRLHSLATIRASRARKDRWEVLTPFGTDIKFLYTADSPLSAAKSYLESMGMQGTIEIFS